MPVSYVLLDCYEYFRIVTYSQIWLSIKQRNNISWMKISTSIKKIESLSTKEMTSKKEVFLHPLVLTNTTREDYHCYLLSLYLTILTFNDLEKEAFRKHCGKKRKFW